MYSSSRLHVDTPLLWSALKFTSPVPAPSTVGKGVTVGGRQIYPDQNKHRQSGETTREKEEVFIPSVASVVRGSSQRARSLRKRETNPVVGGGRQGSGRDTKKRARTKTATWTEDGEGKRRVTEWDKQE